MKSSEPISPERARVRLEELCSRAEVCTAEAADKLRRWGIDPDRAGRIIAGLTDQRYIDDARFTAAFVRDRYLYSRWGRIKIRQALRLKRIPTAMIDEALEEQVDPDTYIAGLCALLRSKARSMPEPLDRPSMLRLMRFAASRGFESSLIMELLRDEDYWRTDPAD